MALVIEIRRTGVGDSLDMRLLPRRQFLNRLRSWDPRILRDVCIRPLFVAAHKPSAFLGFISSMMPTCVSRSYLPGRSRLNLTGSFALRW